MASLKSVNYNESVTVSVLSRDELYIGRYVQSFGNTTFMQRLLLKMLNRLSKTFSLLKLCYAKDYLNILSGKYPYFRVKLLVGEEAKASGVVKVVNKMLSDQIRDLELTIKSTEAGLVAKRNLYENNQTQKDLAFKRAQRIRSYDKMHNDIHKKENC